MHRLSSPRAARELPARGTPGAVAIIPARLQSTRLPEKPLLDLGGAPIVVRVLERARLATTLQDIWVATDDEKIVAAVRAAGGQVVMTRPDHPAGLDRVAEAARLLSDGANPDPEAVFVNLQGDEPFASAAGLDHLVRLFERPEVRMATLAAPFPRGEDPDDPNRVKVVIDAESRALYFSRSRIPSGVGEREAVRLLLHVGIYAYRRSTLLELSALTPAPLERSERLEQLRALHNGIPIHVAVGDYDSLGIDTPEDLARARTQWGQGRVAR